MDLPNHTQQQIENRLASGRYVDADQLVLAALDALEIEERHVSDLSNELKNAGLKSDTVKPKKEERIFFAFERFLWEIGEDTRTRERIMAGAKEDLRAGTNIEEVLIQFFQDRKRFREHSCIPDAPVANPTPALKISDHLYDEIERRFIMGEFQRVDSMLSAALAALDEIEYRSESLRRSIAHARDEIERGEGIPAEVVFRELLNENRTRRRDTG